MLQILIQGFCCLAKNVEIAEDLLDSSGTFFAVAKVAGLTDRNGNLPLARQNMAPWHEKRHSHFLFFFGDCQIQISLILQTSLIAPLVWAFAIKCVIKFWIPFLKFGFSSFVCCAMFCITSLSPCGRGRVLHSISGKNIIIARPTSSDVSVLKPFPLLRTWYV